MRFAPRSVSLALAVAMTALPGIATSPPALAAAAPAPATVARYTFDAGADPTGRVAENSGRGPVLTVRSADGGQLTFSAGPAGPAGKAATFPGPCVATAQTCPRALLEGADDPDLDPGTRLFRWGASVRLTKPQVTGSSSVVQKGVVGTGSQWKMQIGARQGKALCVVVGQGSALAYLVRSDVGVADAGWHRIMCQRSGPVLTVYVDGQARGRITIPATLSIANTSPLRIGGPNLHTKSGMYHGQLDDVYARLG